MDFQAITAAVKRALFVSPYKRKKWVNGVWVANPDETPAHKELPMPPKEERYLATLIGEIRNDRLALAKKLGSHREQNQARRNIKPKEREAIEIMARYEIFLPRMIAGHMVEIDVRYDPVSGDALPPRLKGLD